MYHVQVCMRSWRWGISGYRDVSLSSLTSHKKRTQLQIVQKWGWDQATNFSLS